MVSAAPSGKRPLRCFPETGLRQRRMGRETVLRGCGKAVEATLVKLPFR